MASIPAPIRVTLGLIATALDTVQELVEHAPELPMEAVGNSMQLSLRLQQHYVALLTRGDEFLASLRGAPDEAPAWATFDETPPTNPEEPSTDDVPAADDAGTDLPPVRREGRPRHAGQGDPLLDAVIAAAAPTPPATKAAHEPPPATEAPGTKAPGTKAAGTRTAATKAAGTKVAARKVAAKKVTPATKITATTTAPAAETTQARSPKKAAEKAAKKAATVAPATKARAAKTAPAQAVPKAPVTAKPRRAGKVPAATSTPAQDPAPEPLPEPLPVAVPPATLDAELDNGAESARPQSAFDLAEEAADPQPIPPESPASVVTAVDSPDPS